MKQAYAEGKKAPPLPNLDDIRMRAVFEIAEQRRRGEQRKRQQAANPPPEPPPAPKPAPPRSPLVLELGRDVRARHLYVVGKTGTGKTSLIKHLLRENFVNGDGACLIDPHGDAALEILGLVPDERIADVIYFDPTSANCPAFNPLALRYEPAKLTDDLVSALKLFAADSWGPRLQQLLTFSILTLLAERETHTLRDLERLLIDPNYRASITDRVTDERLQLYWEHQYKDDRASAPAVLNKLSQFLLPSSDLGRVFSERTSALDFTEIMNGKLLVVNLAKGKIGENSARLLGGFFTAAFQSAALARAAIPERDRRPFYLYADEFQNYVVDSFASILSEARKYGLALTLAHQNTAQLDAGLWHAITGNVASIVAFTISADDAQRITREMRKTQTVRSARKHSTGEESPIDAVVRAEHKEAKSFYDWHYRQTYGLAETLGYFPEYQKGTRGQEQWQEAERELPKLKRIMDACDAYFANGSLAGLRHHVKGYDWNEETRTVPSTDDLLTLPSFHGFMRSGRADNVTAFTLPPPAEPSSATVNAILSRPRAATPPTAPERTSPPEPAPVRDEPAAPPPKKFTDDDFRF